MDTHPKVRPYVLTGGRTKVTHQLLMHTLISAPYFDPAYAATLGPEARHVYAAARTRQSVAELSAACGVSLGVTRVILSDLASAQRLRIHQTETPFDPHLLKRVADGLRELA
ncbi:MAG: DUF742 domain-containing protein [Actinocatenispora sp.]